jgi:hypothetical protein
LAKKQEIWKSMEIHGNPAGNPWKSKILEIQILESTRENMQKSMVRLWCTGFQILIILGPHSSGASVQAVEIQEIQEI